MINIISKEGDFAMKGRGLLEKKMVKRKIWCCNTTPPPPPVYANEYDIYFISSCRGSERQSTVTYAQ